LIPDVSDALIYLRKNPQSLKGISRGIERETLRIDSNGFLSKTSHPKELGSALTHKLITTDFAESFLELITPVNNNNVHNVMTLLRDIHRYVVRYLNNERMWPFSMPILIDNIHIIKIAQYGNSNLGKMKTLYRKGLKHRYSALSQIIAGIHYNFSLPLTFLGYIY